MANENVPQVSVGEREEIIVPRTCLPFALIGAQRSEGKQEWIDVDWLWDQLCEHGRKVETLPQSVQPPIVEWEFKSKGTHTSYLDETVRQMGSDGWDIVSVTGPCKQSWVEVIAKRPRPVTLTTVGESAKCPQFDAYYTECEVREGHLLERIEELEDVMDKAQKLIAELEAEVERLKQGK